MSNGDKNNTSLSQQNAAILTQECDWLLRVAEIRIGIYFHQNLEIQSINEVVPPDLSSDNSPYAKLVREKNMGYDERIVLILALSPYIKPQSLDIFMIRNKILDRNYTEFGGYIGKSSGGFLPTLETAIFILAGDNLSKRFELLRLFDNDHYFYVHNILRSDSPIDGEPHLSRRLAPSTDTVNRLTTGITHKPNFSAEFPAKLTKSELGWSDLVLASEVRDQIEHINAWLRHKDYILNDWGLSKNVKRGYRCLFHGPPGTGKTLTATLIGATAGVDVYRIDLSMMVSKYIGETEKNLRNVFDQAEYQNWILFFDEADALFSKRTDASTSNDRHANREVSYLLQRVEDFPGVVILATNLEANIDEAFSRRFQSSIYFPMPDSASRLRLWQGIFGEKLALDPDIDLEQIASDYELAGGAIINVVRYAAINSLIAQRSHVNADDLLQGIRKELIKEGRTA